MEKNAENYIIKTENLSKTYGWWIWKKDKPALDKLNLSIPKGTVFGFLGPNGAGKTTTIRLLMDLIKPTEGVAYVLGKPVDDVEVKAKIGFLPDSPAFSTYLTAYEFLNICAKLLKIPSSERRKRIDEVLEIVQMSEHKKEKLGGFSRGMIQRIGIAQAILNDPELLILDEPLVGLDPHGRKQLKDILFHQKEKSTNVFFCSHILSDVETICDHIGIIYKGRLLCYGQLTDLLKEIGFKATLKPGNDDLLKDILSDAVSSNKLSDGTWELEFSKENKAIGDKLRNIERNNPDAVVINSAKENLEDFFFRKIERAKEQMEKENNG